MSWVPEFVEHFNAQMHSGHLLSCIQLTVAPIPGRYEGHKAITLYTSVLCLRIIGNIDLLKEQKQQIKSFIEASCFKVDKLVFSESPFLANTETHGIVSFYLQLATMSAISEDISVFKSRLRNSLLNFNISDTDLRSLYCYCALKKVSGIEFSDIEVNELRNKVRKLKSFDGGFSLEVGNESHSAANFLAVAILTIIDHKEDIGDADKLALWIIGRQTEMGFSVG